MGGIMLSRDTACRGLANTVVGVTSNGGFVFMKDEIQRYLNWKAINADRAPAVYRIWLEYFDKLIGKPIEKVTIDDLIKYKCWLEDHGKSQASVKLAFTILKNFFKFCLLDGEQCIAQDLIKIPRGRATSYTTVTEEEYQAILKQLPVEDFWTLQRLISIRLLHDTGMRVSELCGLNLADIDPKKSHTTIHTKKHRINRQVVWSPETHDLLIYRYLPLRKSINTNPPLFLGRNFQKLSGRLTTRSVERWLKEASQRAGLSKVIVPHSFRHTWAVDRMGEVPLSFIKEGLGHANAESTFIYLQYRNDEFLKEAIRLFRKRMA